MSTPPSPDILLIVFYNLKTYLQFQRLAAVQITARTLWQGDQVTTSVEYKSFSGCTRVEQKSIMLDKNAGAFDPSNCLCSHQKRHLCCCTPSRQRRQGGWGGRLTPALTPDTRTSCLTPRKAFLSCSVVEPESDHYVVLSVTHQPAHSLLLSKFFNSELC